MYAEAASTFQTVRDLLRFAVSRFADAGLTYGHGTSNAYDEAAYLILSTLKLPIDRLEPFLDAQLLPNEVQQVVALIEDRAAATLAIGRVTSFTSTLDTIALDTGRVSSKDADARAQLIAAKLGELRDVAILTVDLRSDHRPTLRLTPNALAEMRRAQGIETVENEL